jgi:hypothetical protein
MIIGRILTLEGMRWCLGNIISIKCGNSVIYHFCYRHCIPLLFSEYHAAWEVLCCWLVKLNLSQITRMYRRWCPSWCTYYIHGCIC